MPQVQISEYMEHLQGPDFPTGASIHGIEGIESMYREGKGRFHITPSVMYLMMKGRGLSSTKFHIKSKKRTC